MLPAQWQNKSLQYEVFNTTGILLLSGAITASGQLTTIALKKLPRGMYLLKATCGKEAKQKRLIKN